MILDYVHVGLLGRSGGMWHGSRERKRFLFFGSFEARRCEDGEIGLRIAACIMLHNFTGNRTMSASATTSASIFPHMVLVASVVDQTL